MHPTSRSYQDQLLQDLKNPEEAVAYLNAALEEDDTALFLKALRNVAETHGMKHLAQEASLNREAMYRMLSDQGNPQLSILTAILESLGLRLAVEVKDSVAV